MKDLWTKLTTKLVKADVDVPAKKSVKSYYAALVATVVSIAYVATPIMATDAVEKMGTSLSTLFSKIYEQTWKIVSIIACAIIAICLILRMVSKNPRTAEEATSWAKRVFFTWVIFLLLNVAIKFGTSLAKDAGSNTKTPWK